MACGRRVVGTNVGGLAHLIQPAGGRTGPAGDAGALATALGELLHDPEKRGEVGSFNRELIERRYSWHAAIADRESVYGQEIPSVRDRVASPSAVSVISARP